MPKFYTLFGGVFEGGSGRSKFPLPPSPIRQCISFLHIGLSAKVLALLKTCRRPRLLLYMPIWEHRSSPILKSPPTK